jgi:hypothetical protein
MTGPSRLVPQPESLFSDRSLDSMTILARKASQNSNDFLSPSQIQIDLLSSQFISEASDWKNLTGMMAGDGLSCRKDWNNVISVGRLAIARTYCVDCVGWVRRWWRSMTNRACTTLRATSRSPLQTKNDNIWNWSGPGGWKEGLLTSLVTFSLLKGAGHLARQENWVLQQFFPATAMVTGHQAAGALGISPNSEGTLADQLTHALATNLQMGAGMSLLHSFSGGKLLVWEKAMEASSLRRAQRFPGLSTEWAAEGGRWMNTEEIKTTQRPPLMMSSVDDSSSGGQKIFECRTTGESDKGPGGASG